MIKHFRFVWQLLVLSSLIILLGIPGIPWLGIEISLISYIITVLSVTGINLVAWLIMTAGIQKSNRDGVVVLLGGIGAKFLLYLLYLLLFWVVTKILTKPFIITFFALYLVFTSLLAGHLFKLLKNK
jgi:hypothetical protein